MVLAIGFTLLCLKLSTLDPYRHLSSMPLLNAFPVIPKNPSESVIQNSSSDF
jgi:hypothetical protein